MRILHVGVHHVDEVSGGLNRYVWDLVRSQWSRGDDAHLIVLGNGVVNDLDARVHVAAPVNASIVTRVVGVLRAARSLDLASFEVLHVHFALFALPFVLLRSRRSSPRLVVHFHGPWSEESRAAGSSRAAADLKYRIERFVYRRADRLLVLSRAFGNHLSDRYDVDAARIAVVPPGIDTERYGTPQPPSARARLRLPDGPIILAVRRLVPRMGLSDLVRAMVTVPGTCIIAGAGPERKALEDLSQRLGIAGRVRLVGRTAESDLAALYQAATLSVIPSWELEGFGLVALESLAAGTPVVAARQGGLVEAIGGFARAAFYPPRDVEGLARAMNAMICDLPSKEDCVAYAQAFSLAGSAERVSLEYERLVRRG